MTEELNCDLSACALYTWRWRRVAYKEEHVSRAYWLRWPHRESSTPGTREALPLCAVLVDFYVFNWLVDWFGGLFPSIVSKNSNTTNVTLLVFDVGWYFRPIFRFIILFSLYLLIVHLSADRGSRRPNQHRVSGDDISSTGDINKEYF